MMHNPFIRKVLLVPAALFIFSCQNVSQSSLDPTAAFKEREVSIENSSPDSSEVESFQARVKTFYSHNRTGINMEPKIDYLLSMKSINGKVHLRIDYDADTFGDGVARSILSDSSEIVTFQTESGKVEGRSPVPAQVSRLLLGDGLDSLLGRVNLDSVKAKARTLLMDVTETAAGALSVKLPVELLPQVSSGSGYSPKVSRYTLNFDAASGVLVSTEMVTAETEGVTVTSTSYPLYKEEGDLLVKVGEVKTVATEIDAKLDVSDSVVQTYETEEDVPLVSAEELKVMEESGKVSAEDTPILLGDPSDPSYTETFVDLYEDVKMNSLPDSYFKILF